jgi:hypothetical protein
MLSTVSVNTILQTLHPSDLRVLAIVPRRAGIFVPVDILIDQVHVFEGAERGVGIGVIDVILRILAILGLY